MISMYASLERIGELFGVHHTEIPKFISAVEGVIKAHTSTVEDWHGKAGDNS